jgi:hypothetical protein
VNPVESRPQPTQGLFSWRCEGATAGLSTDCSADAVIEAPFWMTSVHDGALLFAGVLLSLAAELLFRGLDARRDST